jgi:hypothetical protein
MWRVGLWGRGGSMRGEVHGRGGGGKLRGGDCSYTASTCYVVLTKIHNRTKPHHQRKSPQRSLA